MRRSWFTETHIVSILKEAEAGLAVSEECRKHGISSATYYKWKSVGSVDGADDGFISPTRKTKTRPAPTANWLLPKTQQP